MRIGIVGGGILGISLAYFLSQEGAEVEVFEASSRVGGLAGPQFLPDGTQVDRFYHAILTSDSHMIEICREMDLVDDLRFKETRMGFFHKGEIYSMNNIVEFLQFPPLNWIDRFRLGLTILNAQFIRDWQRLEQISVEEWLVSWSGRVTYENIWQPLLKAKFDGNFKDLPATYIWARLVRMKSTRSGAAQKEMAGHLVGGYVSLIEKMCDHVLERNGIVHLNQPIEEIMIHEGTAWGLRIGGEARFFDLIISTIQIPIFLHLIPEAPPEYRERLSRMEYMGIISALLVLDRPLSSFWTINITAEDNPFTGVIETTSYIDPQYVGGHHLVYLPKYISPGSEWWQRSDEEIREIWLDRLEAKFPAFDRAWITYFLVHREWYVEPIHLLGDEDGIPDVRTPIHNLYLATTAQIYPELTNGNSITQFASEVKEIILNRSRS